GGCIAYGILMFIVYRYNPSFIKAIEWLMCSLAGSLFPDVDIKSKGQKYFYRFILLLFCVLLLHRRYELFVCCSLLALTPMLARHRGLFHELWFVITAPFMVWFIISNMWPVLFHSFFFYTIF